jgi:hypothetical protein
MQREDTQPRQILLGKIPSKHLPAFTGAKFWDIAEACFSPSSI